jgi:hypothetical protein
MLSEFNDDEIKISSGNMFYEGTNPHIGKFIKNV